MADIIHEHTTTERPIERNSNGIGFLIGAVFLLLALFLLFYYGLPALRSVGGGTQVNVPKQIDVNINQEQPQQ